LPTYEYKCNRCEELFERFQKITDSPLKKCPVCDGKLTRLISGGIGIIFKGSGFYVNDSRNAKNSSFTPKDSDRKADDKSEPTQKPKDSKKSESSINPKTVESKSKE